MVKAGFHSFGLNRRGPAAVSWVVPGEPVAVRAGSREGRGDDAFLVAAVTAAGWLLLLFVLLAWPPRDEGGRPVPPSGVEPPPAVVGLLARRLRQDGFGATLADLAARGWFWRSSGLYGQLAPGTLVHARVSLWRPRQAVHLVGPTAIARRLAEPGAPLDPRGPAVPEVQD